MVDEDVPCEDILAQINAAKSALHGCWKVVLEGLLDIVSAMALSMGIPTVRLTVLRKQLSVLPICHDTRKGLSQDALGMTQIRKYENM